MDSKPQAPRTSRLDGGYGDDSYLCDAEQDRIRIGHYYKLQLPDGRELGSRPFIGTVDGSPFITAGPANTGSLFCIHKSDDTTEEEDDKSEWPAGKTRNLYIRDLSKSSTESDKMVRKADDGRLWWGSDKSNKQNVSIFGDRANGRNYVCVKNGKDNVRLWVGESDANSGHNFIRASHGNALSFEVRFVFVPM